MYWRSTRDELDNDISIEGIGHLDCASNDWLHYDFLHYKQNEPWQRLQGLRLSRAPQNWERPKHRSGELLLLLPVD